MRSADFFDVESFGTATFTTKSVDTENGQIVSDLTLHGVTQEVRWDYTYNGSVVDKWGNSRIGGSGETVVDRRDFGIKYDPTGITIGHDVVLELEVEAIKKHVGLGPKS